ncbi:MAG: hypothetical protein COB61_004120 [Thiotrichales bacterium]|nr:hypothetical protein [Thiotrichales bacterium]
MTDAEIIKKLGGPTKVADLFVNCTPQAVSQWLINGIPPPRRQLLMLLRPDVFPQQTQTA